MPRFAPDDPYDTQAASTPRSQSPSPTATAHDEEAAVAKTQPWWARGKKDENEKEPEDDYVQEVDGVWGKLGEGGPNYKNVGWIKSAIILINLQIGIGVLALPNTLHTIGMIPGIILIIASGIITTWADTVIGLFKRGHPSVYSISDVGEIMAGRFGKELFGGMYWVFCVLVGSGQVLAFSTALNAVSLHGTCTIVFVVIGAGLGIAIGMYRTLDKLSWMMWVALISLMAALIAAVAATGVQDRPAEAPTDQPLDLDVRMFNNPGFLPGVQAGTNIILAFTGGPAFYNVLSEMKQPKDFNKSVYLCQSWVTATYLIIAAVMYSYVGQYVASPALGSAGPLMKRVCYGIVIPGLLIGIVLYVHIPAKYVFVRALRNTRHLTESTWQHWTAWSSCVAGTGILVFIFALAVPSFNDLLTLMSALFGTPLAVTIPAIMWVWETRRTRPASERGLKWWFGAFVCFLLVAVSLFIAIAGTISAVESLRAAVAAGESQPFSCADNSNSV